MTASSAVPPVGERAAQPRTYGNWRAPSSPGLPRLGLLGTVAALSSLVLVMLVQISAGLRPAAAVAVLAAAGIAPLAWRNTAGRNGWQLLLARAAWAWGRARGQTVYLSGLTGPVMFGPARLPGLLACSELLEARTGRGEPFALVSLPSTRQYAVLLRVEPEGAQLVDPSTVDAWVAGWGSWLAALGHEPGLDACSVTVETAPDPGTRLQEEVARLLADTAPPLARALLVETAARYPRGAATLSAHVTLTFSAAANLPAADVPGALARRLPLLLAGLRTAGAGSARAMTAGEVAAHVATAYDPTHPPLPSRTRWRCGGTRGRSGWWSALGCSSTTAPSR